MRVVNHLLDDRDTRFAGITVLETLVVGDRIYVAVSGSDQGVSLLALLPNGQLLHLETLEDTQSLGLGSINALSLSAQRNRIHLVASSGAEAGLTHIVYDPGTGLQLAGTGRANTLTGGKGNDILLDGAGDDWLTGGTGADVFILAADGDRDTITDFEVGIDQIHLSTALTGRRTSPTAIVDAYSRTVSGDLTFWFAGGDKIIFDNGVTETDLIATLYTF